MSGHLLSDWQTLGRHDTNQGMGQYMTSASERSVSADEVENILGNSRQVNRQYMPRPMNNMGHYNGRMMAPQAGKQLLLYIKFISVIYIIVCFVLVAGNLQANAIRRPKGFRPSLPH